MRAVVTVIGKDMVGILSQVSGACAEANANVIEVSQSVLQDMFAMIMLVDISQLRPSFDQFAARIDDIGRRMNLSTHVMHEDIFNSMHHI